MSTEVTIVPPRLGILAGGGSVPAEVAATAATRGWPTHVVTIDGEADADFGPVPVTRVNWGQVGRMIRTFKQTGCTHLVIVGRVSRPDLTRIKPDFGLIASIPWVLKIMASGGDDGVLRNVVRFFEGHGFTVLGPTDVAPHLLIGDGALGAQQLGPEQSADVAKGLDIIRRLGPFDVGQSVVVDQGSIRAIEGAEGTDRMLARLAGRRDATPAPSGLLVKRPKPGQEMRVDLPVIGPETVSRVTQARLAGVAVLAGAVMATQREELVHRADAEGIVVAGVSEATSVGEVPRPQPPSAANDDDTRRALAVRDCLRPDVVSRAVVVARRYVLAVETGEGIEAVLQRVANLRQWGSARLRKRVGVALISGDITVDERLVKLAADAGLSGLVLAADDSGEPFATYKANKCARASGLAIETLGTPDGAAA